MATTNELNMYFDVTCPFAWVTSRWLLEVEKVRDVKVNFIPMSLYVLNDGRDLDPAYMDRMEAAWAPALAAAAIYTKHPDQIADYYTLMGEAIHDENRGERDYIGCYDDLIAEVVEKLDLPEGFIDRIGLRPHAENAFLDELKETHRRGISLVGDEVGTPIVDIEGRGFFGPVLTRVPKGEQAGELFDASVTLGSYPHFFELKRTRTEDPSATETAVG